MTRAKRLVSANEAVPAQSQHTRPCGDCPWARTSLPGWLGSLTAAQWRLEAHGEARVDCHTLAGAQCAGLAIYRSNVCKVPRDPKTLRLTADREAVFGSPQEFLRHHNGGEEA